eukprot:6192228-Pleurochrysis_carterae.AAC.5
MAVLRSSLRVRTPPFQTWRSTPTQPTSTGVVAVSALGRQEREEVRTRYWIQTPKHYLRVTRGRASHGILWYSTSSQLNSPAVSARELAQPREAKH